MSTEENKEIVRRAVAGFATADFDTFVADAADDFTFGLMAKGAPRMQGKDNVRERLRSVLTGLMDNGGAIEMTIEQLIAEGDYVVEVSSGHARTKDGQDYNNVYCRIWHIVDGKIQSGREFLDTHYAHTISNLQ